MEIIPSQTAYLFPGQGSQVVGMGRELAQSYPVARDLFAEADDLLGFSLSQLAWEGPEAELNDTINTQPALLVHSVAALRVLEQRLPGIIPAFVAGHSMGELSALVAAGCLAFPDALRLVRIRGELMKRAGELNPGGMAAIMGLDIPTLDEICARASRIIDGVNEVVQVANDNCPGQVVISGAKPALERALLLAQQLGARRAVPLAVSIPAHSPLMENAQLDFNRAVDQAPITGLVSPIVGNVSARPLTITTEVRADLQGQLTHRVRWAESIRFMRDHGITTFLELGSGNVLCGLLKRIDRDAVCYPMGKPEDFA